MHKSNIVWIWTLISLSILAGILLSRCTAQGQSFPSPPPVPTIGYPVTYPNVVYLPIVEGP